MKVQVSKPTKTPINEYVEVTEENWIKETKSQTKCEPNLEFVDYANENKEVKAKLKT